MGSVSEACGVGPSTPFPGTSPFSEKPDCGSPSIFAHLRSPPRRPQRSERGLYSDPPEFSWLLLARRALGQLRAPEKIGRRGKPTPHIPLYTEPLFFWARAASKRQRRHAILAAGGRRGFPGELRRAFRHELCALGPWGRPAAAAAAVGGRTAALCAPGAPAKTCAPRPWGPQTRPKTARFSLVCLLRGLS